MSAGEAGRNQRPLTPPVNATVPHPVLAAAQDAFRTRVGEGATVSDHTRNAQAICKAWRAAVFDLDPSRYACEVSVAPELEQRIDIFDRHGGVLQKRRQGTSLERTAYRQAKETGVHHRRAMGTPLSRCLDAKGIHGLCA